MISIAQLLVVVSMIIMLYIIYNLYSKNKELESAVLNYQTNFSRLKNEVEKCNNVIKQHHLHEAFRSNDEIGSFFDFLLNVQNMLNEFIR